MILSIDTAAETCSICLHKGTDILSLVETTKENTHVEKITLLISDALREVDKKLNDLEAVALSAGPGSYTGLRVGASTAKGLAYGLGIPMIAIPTLKYLADSVRPVDNNTLIIPMIDARRMEVYTACYDGVMRELKEVYNLILSEDSFDNYLDSYETIYLVGNAVNKARDLYKRDSFELVQRACSAQYMVPLAAQAWSEGDFVDIAYFSPSYYKSPNITRSTKAL